MKIHKIPIPEIKMTHRKGKGGLFGISPDDPFRWKDRTPKERKERLEKEKRKKEYETRKKGKEPREHWYD